MRDANNKINIKQSVRENKCKQFIKIAKEHNCDESETAFESKLRKIAKAKPAKNVVKK